MPTLIDPTQIPGGALEPDDIDAAARRINLIGSSVSTHGEALLRTWQKLERSYQAPEDETLVHVMTPVKGQTSAIGNDLETVATALRRFAEDVRPIKAALCALSVQATTFVAEVADGTTPTIMGGAGYPVKVEGDWDVDDAAVDRNNALIAAVNDQVELLWTAERRCANTILDLTGHARLVAGDAPNSSAATAYGVTAIAAGTPMSWGAEGAIPRTRIRAINDALADVTIDSIVGIYATVGIDASDPEQPDWRLDKHLAITTAVDRLKGFGQLAATAAALSASGQFAARTDTALGAAARKQQNQVTAAGHLLQHSWKENRWGTGTKIVVAGASCFIPGPGWAKTTTTAARGARLASKAVEKSSEAARLARLALKQSRAAGLAEHAVRTGVRTLEMSPSDMKQAVKQLQESLGAPEQALAVHRPKDLTLHMEGAASDGAGHQLRKLPQHLLDETPERRRTRYDDIKENAPHPHLSYEDGAELDKNERRGAQEWLDRGYKVIALKERGEQNKKTPDLEVEGEGRIDIYTPRTTDPGNIASKIRAKARQTTCVQVELWDTSLTRDEIVSISRRTFGYPGKKRITRIILRIDGAIFLDERLRI